MIPPTSIDGTDITGATIDGTDVTEITVDGDTVFSAQTFPVAYSDLVAWYPFDSAEYGGSDADDVTAIIGGSGDDTAYDGTVNGATYQSSGGGTDINAGANSGGFDFNASNDETIDVTNVDMSLFSDSYTFMCWCEIDSLPGRHTVVNVEASGNDAAGLGRASDGGGSLDYYHEKNGDNIVRVQLDSSIPSGYIHIAGAWDGSTVRAYKDGTLVGSTSANSWDASNDNSNDFIIGGRTFSSSYFDGRIDDFRIYDTSLSGSQINQIYQNTEP